MTNSLKEKTGFAIFWSMIDKGGQQLLQLIFGVVLARILLPSETGLFALLAIFTAIANILQESGFSSALIRNKQPSDTDYASVFYFNVSISIFIYVILYSSAPLISHFYNEPILIPLSRVVFLSFLFNSFGLIQNVNLVRAMDFKTNTKITLIAGSIAGVAALTLALNGYGVWSLAIQLVLQSLVRFILLWLFVKWRPKARFSFATIKGMSSYSSKLLLTSVMNQFCSNLYANIIGKCFSIHQVGVYSQANKFSIIPQSVINDGIKGAAFPALSKIENDLEYTKKAFRKVMRIMAFISFPVAALVIVIAKPVILLLITDKWADSIPILQILAIGTAFYPCYGLISTLLQTIGKSGLLLKIEAAKNIFAVVLIFATIHFGVHGLAMGISLVGVIAFFIGMSIAGRHIKYSFIEIAKDTIPYIVIATISIVPFLFMGFIGVNNLFLLLLIPIIAGSVIYLTILKILGSVILSESITFLKKTIVTK